MAPGEKIRLEDVSVSFGGVRALDGVSFDVRAQELLCIIGTSGGGKTTLLRTMGGLIPPTAGRVLLDGELITRPDPRLSFIFQHFGLFPWKTVRENIEYGLVVQRRRPEPERIDGLLAMMGLTTRAGAYPYQLSGGMQQRVGIARALAVQPEVFLMDEPFTALDAITREELQVQFLRLWQEQARVTAVVVTHDIDEAILLGDRVVVLHGPPGRVQLELEVSIERPRSPHEVRSHPEYRALRQRLWDALRPDGASADSNVTTNAVGA